MDILISYICKSFIASGILYFYYLVALKNKKFHSYNRVYLLLSVAISLVIPFINLSWLYIEESQNTRLSGFVNSINPPAAIHAAKFFTTGQWLIVMTALISVLLLSFFVSKLIWIYRIKRKNTNTKMHGFIFIETEAKQAPFSFLNNLFWKQGFSVTDANGEKIFKHELTHIIQGHTYDKLFTQILCCTYWINPFYWLIQRELNTIHEFIADAAAVKAGDTESFARMLLHSYDDGSYLSPYHPFFNSSIKRRLIMISSSNKTHYSWLRRILALPVMLLVLAALSVSLKAQTDTKTNFQPVNKIQQSSVDTIPNSDTIPSKRIPEPITITVKPSGKDQNKIEDVTVTGRQSDTKSRPEPITITGKQSGKDQNKIGVITVTGRQSDTKPGLEPITIAGQQAGKDQNKIGVVTVTGRQSDTKPSLEPITIAGKQANKDQNKIGIIISEQPTGKKQDLKPIAVTGQKSDDKPSQKNK